MAAHVPVMLREVLELLAPKPGARVVDATVGAGGHAEALLLRIGPEGRLLGLDRDAEMLALSRKRLARFGDRVVLAHAPHSRLAEVARARGFEPADIVLLDLGLCSAQLDDRERGLSFRPEARQAPLDMRMDRSGGRTAAGLLRELDEAGLASLLREEDVPAPRRVARALVAAAPLETAGDLLDALSGLRLPRRRHHPATLVFQALRRATNDEGAELEAALGQAVDLLGPRGRLAVLSYHSGEDRRVKQALAREERGCICPPRLPACACGRTPRVKLLSRGQGPGEAEVAANPRARSARLRGAERR